MNMEIISRRITMSRWSREYINSIEAELRRKIEDPRNTRIQFNIVGDIDEITMKTLAFMQLKLTGFAYLPSSTEWDIVEKWVLTCPIASGVERYSQ